MDITAFFALANAHPWSYLAIFLNIAVIFINGWTDGPNSIATCVTTRAMKAKKAVAMSAFFNFLGVLSIGFLAKYLADFGDVSRTIASLVNWPSGLSVDREIMAICSGLIAIIAWSLGSTYFGFPSSESNELAGGISGAAVFIGAVGGQGWFSCLEWGAWSKILFGFFGSLLLGFLLGWVFTKAIELICQSMTRGKTTRFFAKGQIVSAGFMSYVHGIQDGAKFIGIFIMIAALLAVSSGTSSYAEVVSSLSSSWWIFVPVAFVMGGGTLMGGYNIIKTLGGGMAKLQMHQAFATDLASAFGLLLATFFGIPVSTGTVKSTAILGGGATRGIRRVHWDVAGKMVGSWIIIFPLTAVIGFAFTALFFSFVA